MPRSLPADLAALRGWGQLACEATVGLTDVVESMHHEIARVAPILGVPSGKRTRGVTGLVYRSIRGVTRLLGAVLGRPGSLPRPEPLTPGSERLTAAVNGVVGDHLEATRNPLAIAMALRRHGHSLTLERAALSAALPDVRAHVVVLIHGLCMSDAGWSREEWDLGARLEGALGCIVLFLRYNSGRHISSNGRALSSLLEELTRAWPVPLERLSLIGHSMGGLVARSACAAARRGGQGWTTRLRDLVCLGSPHLGAPLPRGGHWLQAALGVSPYTAHIGRLGRLCSAGLTDLRHGSLLDEDWEGGDRFALRIHQPGAVRLPEGVRCLAVAGDTGWPTSLVGDGLVPVDSALGRHADPARVVAFPDSGRWVMDELGHMDLLSDPGLHARLETWLAAGA